MTPLRAGVVMVIEVWLQLIEVNNYQAAQE